jgi:hypothetical protein
MSIRSLAKNSFRAAIIGLPFITHTPPAAAQMYTESYQINRIYQGLKDIAVSSQFSQFENLIRGTAAYQEPNIRRTFDAMRIFASGRYDQNNGAKLALSYCISANLSSLLHLGGQRNNSLRLLMNDFLSITTRIAESDGGRASTANCPAIYSRYP